MAMPSNFSAPFAQACRAIVVLSADTLSNVVAIHSNPLTWAVRIFFYDDPTVIIGVRWSGQTPPKDGIGRGRAENHRGSNRHQHGTHLQQGSHERLRRGRIQKSRAKLVVSAADHRREGSLEQQYRRADPPVFFKI
jgi:hypothetical protein